MCAQGAPIEGNKMTTPDKHALKIARDTMKMHCVGAWIMGQTHKQAAETIERLTGEHVELEKGCTCDS
jgi:hypothetical protein